MDNQEAYRVAGLTGEYDSIEAYMKAHRKRREERRPRGEKHANAKLTEDQVREIRRSYAAGEKNAKELAQAYGVISASIDNIVNGATWGHVEGISQENLEALKKARKAQNVAKATDATRKLTEADVRAIRAEYVPGKVRMKDIADRYGVKQPTISDIITRRTWNHIN